MIKKTKACSLRDFLEGRSFVYLETPNDAALFREALEKNGLRPVRDHARKGKSVFLVFYDGDLVLDAYGFRDPASVTARRMFSQKPHLKKMDLAVPNLKHVWSESIWEYVSNML